jgi:hypothetical protein
MKAFPWGACALLILGVTMATAARADVVTPVPISQRQTIDAERSGQHDANNIRTVFWNYGMVGDYPQDPIGVDLSVFHSVEVPKGSGMNYSDGITPFVLARIMNGPNEAYIMETGYRERQDFNVKTQMIRFEPRPGYFEPDPDINKGRSIAMSHDSRTWPSTWPDRLDDSADPGWPGSWNGYFGKRPAADQESYSVMDDDMYDSWFEFNPDSRDPTRRGLGLRVEVRGFQWSNPQAGNVIFWHYDITNEGTTDYDDNIIFGLYMDSGVGGSRVGGDQIAESDDDNAYFDRSLGLNLVYTWDTYGHGVDLQGLREPTGYLGYAYLETPGNQYDGADNDDDGITDEARDGGPGTRIDGQDAILAYVASHYDTTRFVRTYGALVDRPAYRAGTWWTGDEDMDWVADLHDLGADGVKETNDAGEKDGIPTEGETNFDRTDLNESDQIGLTGFKMNRIKAGANVPDPRTDNILFYTETQSWPARLYQHFTDPTVGARFDSALVENYNIGFLFASGPFRLPAGKRERFSLALGYGADLTELRETIRTVQQIYNANYQFAVPPEMPTAHAEAGDGYVRLTWDDVAERSIDPVSYAYDFEGYRIYRSTDPDFLDTRVLISSRGNPLPSNGKPIHQMDLIDGKRGNSKQTVDGVAFWLGTETGIQHTWIDTTVTNGQQYYYAVTAYDYGSDTSLPDSLQFYPSENAIAVSRTPRGGTILPRNVVAVRPNPKPDGWTAATVGAPTHVAGTGSGSVRIEVLNSNEVPDDHLMKLSFTTPAADSIRANHYVLTDSTTGRVLFSAGADLDGVGIGPIAAGLLPVVTIPVIPTMDSTRTGWVAGSATNVKLDASWIASLGEKRNLRREGYPDDISVIFTDTVSDTSTAFTSLTWNIPYPTRFYVVAHTDTGDVRLDFRFRQGAGTARDSTIASAGEIIDILTKVPGAPLDSSLTWRLAFNATTPTPIVKPKAGDEYRIVVRHPFTSDDVFLFNTSGQRIDASKAKADWSQKPYVVPNPYVGRASFEPERYAVSGRGERRLEFRAIPQGAVIRIYTVRGDLVQTLRQDGSATDGYVPWNLRSKDNLDVAPGLYIFHVEAPGLGEHVGKFAVIK